MLTRIKKSAAWHSFESCAVSLSGCPILRLPQSTPMSNIIPSILEGRITMRMLWLANLRVMMKVDKKKNTISECWYNIPARRGTRTDQSKQQDPPLPPTVRGTPQPDSQRRAGARRYAPHRIRTARPVRHQPQHRPPGARHARE